MCMRRSVQSYQHLVLNTKRIMRVSYEHREQNCLGANKSTLLSCQAMGEDSCWMIAQYSTKIALKITAFIAYLCMQCQ